MGKSFKTMSLLQKSVVFLGERKNNYKGSGIRIRVTFSSQNEKGKTEDEVCVCVLSSI